MLKNYFTVAWRNLLKHKIFSTINIGGLAIGIASSILLLSYVSFQFNYDSFHANKQNIYRVNLDYYQNGQLTIHSAENYSAVGPALKQNFPEVQDQARCYNMGYKNNCIFSYENNHFKETKFLYTDASFLTMFSFPFLQGDPRSALTEPYSIVISETTAKRLFGDPANPAIMGKMIQMNDDDRNSELCKVTGVFRDIPDNSHIKFNILISYPTLYGRGNGLERFEHTWGRKDFYTYILLRPGTNPASLEASLPALVNRNMPGAKANHEESRLSLQPLGKIHLSPERMDEPEPTGHAKAMLFLMIISFFIITIAWVNYINLTTANSVNRAKEIGIRKVLGSQRLQLMRMFLTESLILNVVSTILAVFLVYSLRPFLHGIFNIDFPLSALFTNGYGLIFIAFLLAGTLLSGLYPALVLSSFKPIAVLKGKVKATKNGLALRKSLVVFQFALSILLITGTIIVYQQVHFMLNQNLGINVNQVVEMDRPGKWDTARATHNLLVQRFRDILKKDPAVESVGMADEVPGKEIRWPSNYTLKSGSIQNTYPIFTTTINEEYLSALGMNILAGRNFSEKMKTDAKGVILTESAVRLMGFTSMQTAIGKVFRSDDGDYTVIGVVNDFHQLSLQKSGAPAAFQFGGGDLREYEYYLIKMKTTNVHEAINRIDYAWTSTFKDNPFEFNFLDDYFNRQYQSEIRFGTLFGAFSVIAIVIACIGLFALVAFMVEQRTKEIGVRKVLGADTKDILVLLSKDFVILVLAANIIAWPLGWVLMNNWLMDFAYRIHIQWLVFVLAGLTALLIALATISFQTVRAAFVNPINSLRTE